MGLITGGKDGVYYHVNRANMGKTSYTQLVDSPFVASFDYRFHQQVTRRSSTTSTR